MSTARIFDFAEYVEPATDPHGIPPVSVEVQTPSRSFSETAVGRTCLRAWRLTKPTRIGYQVRRRENRKYLANPHGAFLADEYMADVESASQYLGAVEESTDDLDELEAARLDRRLALRTYSAQVRRNERRACMRATIAYGPRLALMGEAVYGYFTASVLLQTCVWFGISAIYTARWTVRGRRVMKARRRMLAKRRGTLRPVNLPFEAQDLPVTASELQVAPDASMAYVEPSDTLPEHVEEAAEVEQVARDPRYRLLYDILDVATPTAGQKLDDPLSEFVIQTDPLVELLRKHSAEYKHLDRGELIKKLGRFGLRSHQKNLPETWDGKRPNRTGWHFAEINDVIERGKQWES